MPMANEIQAFENKYMMVMANIASLEKQVKKLQDRQKSLKEELEKAMDEYNIQSIDNEYVKITRIEASETVSIDLKELQKKEPELYNELLKDYPKVTKRKAYVRITVK